MDPEKEEKWNFCHLMPFEHVAPNLDDEERCNRENCWFNENGYCKKEYKVKYIEPTNEKYKTDWLKTIFLLITLKAWEKEEKK